MIPFCVVYGRDPPQLLPYRITADDPPVVTQWFQHRDVILSQIKSNLLKSQVRMKKFADAKCSEI